MPPFVGSFAEYVLAYTDFIALKPSTLTHAEASVLPLAGLTVVQAFDDAHLKKNDRICILGASGGTGHLAVQVAKIRGAVVTAVCSSKNSSLMKNYGADHVVCYDEENVVAGLQHIAEIDGLYDFVFDSVSSDDPRYKYTIEFCKLLSYLTFFRDAVHEYEKRICSSSPPVFNHSTGIYIMLGGHVSSVEFPSH